MTACDARPQPACCAPRARLDRLRRRRRGRLRHRRPDRRAAPRRHAGPVLLVTKARPRDGSTRWAQGGIAAALDPATPPRQHLADTLVAGAGLCDADAVRALVTEGPARGARADRRGRRVRPRRRTAASSLTREGGHHARPHRARRRRRHRRRDLPRPARRGSTSRPRASRSSSTPWSSTCSRRGRPRRRVTLHVIGEGAARRRRRGARPRRRAGHRRPRPGLTRHHQPVGGHRRRRGARPARRRGCATSSSCSSTRPCSGSARARAASSR